MKNHAVIILRNEELFLFVQRSATKKSLPNIWAFPSGTVEEGESASETIVREAKEELSVDVNIEKDLAKVELPELGACLHFFVCINKSNQELICDPNEIQQTQWMTFAEFFKKFNDDQIGHGLRYLRNHPEIWKKI